MRNPIPTQTTPHQVAQPAVNVTGRARAKQPVSNNKATVNGTTGLSKAQKRRLRTQRLMNGVKGTKKQLPVVSKQTPTTKAKSVQSTPSLSAQTPIQTPMQAPVQFQSRSHVPTAQLIELDADTNGNAKQEPKLSKAQKRKLRKQKKTKNGVVTQQAPSICSSVGPTKPPMPNNPVYGSRPSKPPMSNSKSKSKAKAKAAGIVQSEPKMSKAQKRKMRKNKLKNAA